MRWTAAIAGFALVALAGGGARAEFVDVGNALVERFEWEEGCVILIVVPYADQAAYRGEAGMAQALADGEKIKELMVLALEGSADMREKTREACAANREGFLQIDVFRDSPSAHLGSYAPGTSSIKLDLGDVEHLSDHMTGDVEVIDDVIDNWLVGTLAHEIDHARDDGEEKGHKDPDRPATGFTDETDATKGPAVLDANQVKEDLGIANRRKQYTYRGPDGGVRVGYAIGDRGAILDATAFFADLMRADRERFEAEEEPDDEIIEVDPEELDGLPDRPCDIIPGAPCFLPATVDDADLDGVPGHDADGEHLDNCPGHANPQQADADGDGVGDGCEDTDPPPAGGRAVVLDFPTAGHPADTVLCLDRVVLGCTFIGPECLDAEGEPANHLHDFIFVDDVGVPDPDSFSCGHGIVVNGVPGCGPDSVPGC